MKPQKVLILLFSILLISCKGKTKHTEKNDGPSNANEIAVELRSETCMERILLKDSILGNVRNQASKNTAVSEVIVDYTNSLEALDYTDCPEKFISAFHDHIEAWKRVTRISDKYPSLRGELHEVFAELEKSEDSTEFKFLVQQVWDTWETVEENTGEVN